MIGSDRKSEIFKVLEIAEEDDSISKIFDIFIMSLISLNVVAVILETVESLALKYATFFLYFEVASVAIFSIEYILRVWSATSDDKFKNPIKGRLKFAFTPLALVDLLAIIPFYLPVFIAFDLRILRALRLMRITRILKIGRYSKAVTTFGNVIRNAKEELVITAGAVLILLIVSSSVLFYTENSAQPDLFSSIPATMWWSVATLTTVGYGDMYPITPLGKFFGAFIALLGIGLFALPAGILASKFAEEIRRDNCIEKVCPHCNNKLKMEDDISTGKLIGKYDF